MNNSSSNTTSSSNTGRSIQNFLSQTPIFVAILLVVNIGIHIIVFITSLDISPYVFQSYRVWYYNQYYRMITSAFLHGGIMHIGMNMMSLVAIGGMLEPVYGSFRFIYLTWITILLGGICYLILAFSTAWITSDWSYIGVSSIGYSGVLFSYAVMESFHSTVQSRSLFGLINVPTKLYPFILLIVLQFLLPNISLFGHLGGLLAGIIMMTSIGNQLLVPSQACMEWLESILIPSFVKRQSSYRPMTDKEFIHPSLQGGDVRSVILGIWGFIVMAITCVLNIFITIAHICGIPLDRYLQSCYDGVANVFGGVYNSLCSCCGAISEGATSVASTASSVAANPMAHSQGYEQVPNDSSHDRDIELNSVTAPPSDITPTSIMTNNNNTTPSQPQQVPLFAKPGNKLGGGTSNPKESRIVNPRNIIQS